MCDNASFWEKLINKLKVIDAYVPENHAIIGLDNDFINTWTNTGQSYLMSCVNDMRAQDKVSVLDRSFENHFRLLCLY